MRKVASTSRAQPGLGDRVPLDDVELRILELWSRGASTTEVAGRLRLSEAAVDASTGRILGKLGVQSRVEAVAHGLAVGLLGSRPGSP